MEGEVDGVLESQSMLTVGPNGKVKGNIKAQEVAIFGSVHGNVEVTSKISIREQGSLIGDIRGAGIRIDDGAYFKGSVDIIRPEKASAVAKAAAPWRNRSWSESSGEGTGGGAFRWLLPPLDLYSRTRALPHRGPQSLSLRAGP